MNEHPADAAKSETDPAEAASSVIGGLASPTSPSAAPSDITAPAAAPAHPAQSGVSFAFATPRVLAGVGLNAAIAVAATIVAALGALFVLLVIVPQSNTPFDVTEVISPDPGVVLAVIGVLAGFALGGEINLEILGAAQANLVLLPLTLIVGIALASSWWGFRAERTAPLASPIERAIASAATGVIAAGLVTGLAAISTIRSSAEGVSVVVASAGWRVFLTGLVVIAASAFLGRALATRSTAPRFFAALGPAHRTAAPALREAVGYAAIIAVVFVPAGVLVALVAAMQSGAPGGSLVSLLLFGLNSMFFVAALAHLGSMQFETTVSAFGASQTESGTYWAFSTEFGAGWGVLLVVVALIVTAYATIWLGLRRPRTGRVVWARVWQLPVITLVAWVVIAVLAIHGSLDASGTLGFISGSLHGGIGVTWWTPLLLALWAGIVSVGAEFAPGLAYSVSPGVVRRVGGLHATQAWLHGATASAGTDAAAEIAISDAPVLGLASASTSPDSAVVPRPAPMDPARRRRLLIWGAIVGGVAVLAIAAVSALSVLNASRSPEARVAEYVGHIARGDAELASAAVDPNVPSAERALLTDAALGGAAQRISDVRTAVVSTEGDIATVGVTYRLDGVDEYAELRAERGLNEYGVLDTWRVVDPLVAGIEVFTNVYDELAVAGIGVTIEGGDTGASRIVYVYPGMYEVSPPASEYYSASPTTVRAVGAGGSMLAFAEVRGEPTEALTSELSAQVNALLDECVRSTESAPDGCPLYTWTAGDAPVTWAIVEYPELEMIGPTSFQTVGGEVTYAYTYTIFGSEYARDGSQAPVMFGDVGLEGGELVMTFPG